MKLTLNWLKQYVDVPWTAAELAERLTMLGLEVEGVQTISGEFEGVVVAEIIESQKHPNADKLSVCKVLDGQGQRQIVCGAKNFKVGDKVPLILPGASLPPPPGAQPFVIKAAKMRGVESQGMLCSPKELGLAEDADGLLILPPEAKVGQAFAEHLGRASGDVVYDLEITPNRPDLNSVLGIAREIAALTGQPLRLPEISFSQTSNEPIDRLVAVRIEDSDLCPRYVARIVRGVRVGPSPDWLRTSLEKIGLRSINNVVDVTNYVLMESGQPLHAFDLHLLARQPQSGAAAPVIVIRRAVAGEKMTTLDAQERTLTADTLLIADETKPIALAGVMGGLNSEINTSTADVLIESAYFKPQNIRATSKRLDLRTDASYRFERGADIGITDWASRRAARLIQQVAGGTILEQSIDAFPNPRAPVEIRLRHQKTNALLGIKIEAAQQDQFLERLGLERIATNGESSTFRVPTFRVDLKRETDLIEEVTRLYGVDKIPSTEPRGARGANSFDTLHEALAEARRILTSLGLFEAQGQTLISSASARLALAAEANPVALSNPLSSDMDALRPSLLPGLLDSLRHNLNHKTSDVALFEIGRVFNLANNQMKEERRIAVAITGQRHPAFWGDKDPAKSDLADLKGMVEELFEQLGLRGAVFQQRPASTTLYHESASVILGKQEFGELGQVSPLLARKYDLRDGVFVAEFNLDMILARRQPSRSFRALPAFPAIRRDVAMIVAETTTHDRILSVVKQLKPASLETVELFDVFRGGNVPAHHKSVAYAFTYRSPERTLTDAEVNAAHQKIVERFKSELQATVREAGA